MVFALGKDKVHAIAQQQNQLVFHNTKQELHANVHWEDNNLTVLLLLLLFYSNDYFCVRLKQQGLKGAYS